MHQEEHSFVFFPSETLCFDVSKDLAINVIAFQIRTPPPKQGSSGKEREDAATPYTPHEGVAAIPPPPPPRYI